MTVILADLFSGAMTVTYIIVGVTKNPPEGASVVAPGGQVDNTGCQYISSPEQ